MWLYRLFKRNVANTLITVDSSVTSGIKTPAITVTGTTTQTGVATFTAAPVINNTPTISGVSTGIVTQSTATPYFYKILTVGAGSSVIDWWVGPTTSWLVGACYGPTPAHKGDILVSTGTAGSGSIGKMYIASAATASSDWKLVTSA